MDDMYQYASGAVNDSQNAHAQEEDDVILKAFNNFGFSSRWSSLVESVRKQARTFAPRATQSYYALSVF